MQDAFIVDTGANSIFVWIGKKANKDERKAAFKNARDFIQTKGYKQWCSVTTVKEGTETPLFKQNFSDWLNKGETTSLIRKKRAPGRKYTHMHTACITCMYTLMHIHWTSITHETHTCSTPSQVWCKEDARERQSGVPDTSWWWNW